MQVSVGARARGKDQWIAKEPLSVGSQNGQPVR